MIKARGTASASLLNHLLKEKPPFLDSPRLATGDEKEKILLKVTLGYYRFEGYNDLPNS